MDGLKPANANAWYVLMTLYGEQVGEEIDEDLHARNRAAWNAWSCQGMDDQARAAAASSKVSIAELSAWPELKADVTALHRAAMLERNGAGFDYPGLPDVAATVDLRQVAFDHLLVLQRTVFSGDTWFVRARFGGDARFERAVFSGAAMFNFATFSGDAWFDAAVFSGAAVLISAMFSRAAGFGSARFSGDTLFGAAKFSGFAYFPKAEFGAVGRDHVAIFTGCQFEKPTSLYDAIFHSRYPDFTGAMLHDQTTFSAEDQYWPKGGQVDPKQAKASCAAIRHSMGRQGLPEAEHFFFRREMGFATQIGGCWARLPYQAFEVFSGFGHSLMIPFGWLGLFWGLGAACYWHYLATQTGQALALGTAAAFSFSNLFQIFGFGRLHFDTLVMKDLPTVLKVYAGVQTVVALPLLFFLGLGLRQRFRLR